VILLTANLPLPACTTVRWHACWNGHYTPTARSVNLAGCNCSAYPFCDLSSTSCVYSGTRSWPDARWVGQGWRSQCDEIAWGSGWSEIPSRVPESVDDCTSLSVARCLPLNLAPATTADAVDAADADDDDDHHHEVDIQDTEATDTDLTSQLQRLHNKAPNSTNSVK